MQGLEISKKFWNEYGKPLLEKEFPEIIKYLAVGLVGSGSECYGFDDEISHDHDFEHGFCIFLPNEDKIDRRTEFLIERAYSRLPREFMGLIRSNMNPAGGNRRGVFRTSDFYVKMTGIPHAPMLWQDWLSIPDYALFEVTDGDVFFDGLGEFSKIREAWKNPPPDVKFKKLCGYLLSMSQSGEYNYSRCLERGEKSAARLAAAEFVKSCIGAALWLQNKPMPYYKWAFRALGQLENSQKLCGLLESVLEASDAREFITATCREIISQIDTARLLPEPPSDLQKTAFDLNDCIFDTELRNLSPLSAI